MKRVLFAVVASLCVASVVALAQAPAVGAKEVTVKGTVHVTKDQAGAVQAVVIKDALGKETKIALDAEGKKLEAMSGKMVEAKGTEKDGVLTVKECKAVEPPPAKK